MKFVIFSKISMFLAIKFNIFAGLFKSIKYSAYFCKKKLFCKTPHAFYRLVQSGNLFRAAGKILPFQGWSEMAIKIINLHFMTLTVTPSLQLLSVTEFG